MDAPSWWDLLIYGRSARRQLRDATLRFVGYKPVSVSQFFGVGHSTAAQREAMLRRARRAGQADAQALLKRYGATAATARRLSASVNR